MRVSCHVMVWDQLRMKGHHFHRRGSLLIAILDLKNRTECRYWKMAVPIV